jgi:TolA protein
MNMIKSFSLGIITTAIVVSSFSLCCMAADTITETNEAKHDYTQEEVITDKTPAIEEYIASSRKKIKNNWYPPVSSFENTATIIVTLDKSGKLTDCNIAVSSDNKEFDNSLIKAVKKTKFAPLPDEVSEEYLDIDFTFNMQKRHIEK